ncbi:MAG: flavodoxin domain-containing protein [Spirochaetales bacterium]|nr:flavodoxin domain-containing protein [Spirochaetales bacterium]
MKIVIVYDSVFGNTEKIAQAMGKGLGSGHDVTVAKVGTLDAEILKNAEGLVVGSPTRAFQPTKAIKNFLKSFSRERLQGIRVAAFDTRVLLSDVNSGFLNFMVKLFGYAAEPIAAKLVKYGGKLSLSPEGFYVNGTEGPLKDGEEGRAVEWIKQLSLNG